MTDRPTVVKPKGLMEPGNTVLLLIDHQPMTLFGLRSHDPQAVIDAATALARTARAFGVPTIVTSAAVDGIGGEVFPEIRAVLSGAPVLNRANMDTWE